MPNGLKMYPFIGRNSDLGGWNLFFKDLGLDELTQGSGKREERNKQKTNQESEVSHDRLAGTTSCD